MNKKLPLVAALLGAIFLTGCSTVPESQWQYNDRYSRAHNIATTFQYHEGISDTDAPEGYEGDGSFLLEGASFAASLDAASKINGFLPGISGWGAVGFGLLGGVINAVGESVQPQNNLGFVGYLPAAKAKDEVEARKIFVQETAANLGKSAQELYPNTKVQFVLDFNWEKSFLVRETYGITYEVIEPKWGCEEGHNFCWFRLIAQDVQKLDGIHQMFEKADQPHYKLTPNKAGAMIKVSDRLAEHIDVAKWLANTSKYLPEKMFIYVPPMKNADKKDSPRMVIEKDRVDLFIKPPKKKN